MDESVYGGLRSFASYIGLIFFLTSTCWGQQTSTINNAQLSVAIRAKDGAYEVRLQDIARPVFVSRVAAEVDHRWLLSTDFARHGVAESNFEDELGPGKQLTVTFSGLSVKLDLVCILRLYNHRPFGDVKVRVRNRGPKSVTVQAIRIVDALGEPRVDLSAPVGVDRVMSDSFSEGPTMKIARLADSTKGMHRGEGTQLIYNQDSRQSLLLATLTSEKFLTILRLQVEQPSSGDVRIASFTAESTGTTEIQEEWGLYDTQPLELIELNLPVLPGEELSSERLLFAGGSDYHAQLEAYGEAVRLLHRARVGAKNLIGWWSWAAFYAGITEGSALTNARWLSEHLKGLGYEYFHIDEGYQYARGEYTTANATQFPHGMLRLGHQLCRLGLTFGIWTAPFEVSGRAWVYQHHHPDWLVHDARGKPIPIGFVARGTTDPLYVLDTTHRGAQEYLRRTYRTLTREWGVRYIKLDFMDSTAIEGYRYRPNTTALEAQHIGLSIIRNALGQHVLLDKDGSPMLNPVGIVDEGRISTDTAHSFHASKNAAPNVAARYYMNGNFYRSDPDAFTVSQQVISEQRGQQSESPLTLDEAQVSIVLAAISGGMYEIGDDLPTLGADRNRLALVENPELLQMAKLGRAAIPLDLMTFRPEDEMPSVFLLLEDARQSMLAVFNWTESHRSRSISLAELKLSGGHPYQAFDALNNDEPVDIRRETLTFENQAPHSVRLIKILDNSMPAAAPTITGQVPARAQAGDSLELAARAEPRGVPALLFHWDFGDGTAENGEGVSHTYTRSGDYTVRLKVDGVDGIPAEKSFAVTVSGWLKTQFNLLRNRRYKEKNEQ